MKRYLIESVQCGISEGGIACGPVDGSVIVTVKYNDGEAEHYISLVDTQGFPSFYLTDQDVFEDLLKEDFEDDDFQKLMIASSISDFNGIEFDERISDMYENIHNDPSNPAIPLLRYLTSLDFCSEDENEVKRLTEAASGKYVDEIAFPLNHIEEEYMEGQNKGY